MTPTEYRANKPPIWKENLWEYFISIGVIGVGIFFHYLIFATNWPQNTGDPSNRLTEFQLTVFFCVLYLMGIYGIWRIKAGYNFISLKSNLTIEEKQKIVDKAFKNMGKKPPNMASDCIDFVYRGFLGFGYNVTILLDDQNFYINAETPKDLDGGMIDFGVSYRIMKKIRKNIKACL